MPILSLNIYFSFWIPFSSTLIWKKTFTRTTLWLSSWTVNKTGQLTKGVKENNARKAPELKCWTVRIAVIFLYTIDHLLGAGRIWASRIRLVLDSTPNVNVIFACQLILLYVLFVSSFYLITPPRAFKLTQFSILCQIHLVTTCFDPGNFRYSFRT